MPDAEAPMYYNRARTQRKGRAEECRMAYLSVWNDKTNQREKRKSPRKSLDGRCDRLGMPEALTD
jgi:hypothetical protein